MSRSSTGTRTWWSSRPRTSNPLTGSSPSSNERGLDLTHTDILKSEIIGEISEPDQDAYIRMVFAKTKARESILKEFRSSVLAQVPDGRKFIDDVLVPLSDAFEIVTRADYKATAGADAVNHLLRWLNLLDNTDWVPPAIHYPSRPAVDTNALLRFLTDLERLAASMLVRRVDITRRIERYGRVLDAIQSGTDLYAPGSPLQLDENERADTRQRLDGEIYTVTRVLLYMLLRLDSALSSAGSARPRPQPRPGASPSHRS